MLKLELLGKSWTKHFPQLAATTTHPDWKDFSTRVKQQHQEGLSQATPSAGVADNAALQVRPGMASEAAQPVYKLCIVIINNWSVLQDLQAQVQHLGGMVLQQSAENKALLQQFNQHNALQQQLFADLPDMLATVVREAHQAPAPDERPAKQLRIEALPDTNPPAAAAPPRARGLVFVLGHCHTVAYAYARYKEIQVSLKAGLSWQEDRHKTAFNQFKLGLAAEVEKRGVEELERERLMFNGHGSQLQSQACHYTKKHKKKPCARKCTLCNP